MTLHSILPPFFFFVKILTIYMLSLLSTLAFLHLNLDEDELWRHLQKEADEDPMISFIEDLKKETKVQESSQKEQPSKDPCFCIKSGGFVLP